MFQEQNQSHTRECAGMTSELRPLDPQSGCQATNEVVMSLRDRNNIGRAQFTHPLRHSLLLLDNSTECHRVLIIFSDGDSETAIPTGLVRSFNRDNEVGVANY